MSARRRVGTGRVRARFPIPGTGHARRHPARAGCGGALVRGRRRHRPEFAEGGRRGAAGPPDTPAPPGISVFDAETDEDLRRVAAYGRCGAGPRAVDRLGRSRPGARGRCVSRGAVAASAADPRPVRLRSGRDRRAARRLRRGLDAVAGRRRGQREAARPTARKATAARWPASTCRRTSPAPKRHSGSGPSCAAWPNACRAPERCSSLAARRLRGLCLSLGARSLEVQGRIVPGLPRSVLRGGVWDGVTVVSKSGAFGTPTLLRDLLRSATPPLKGRSDGSPPPRDHDGRSRPGSARRSSSRPLPASAPASRPGS